MCIVYMGKDTGFVWLQNDSCGNICVCHGFTSTRNTRALELHVAVPLNIDQNKCQEH